jgi:hypothetical protein
MLLVIPEIGLASLKQGINDLKLVTMFLFVNFVM